MKVDADVHLWSGTLLQQLSRNPSAAAAEVEHLLVEVRVDIVIHQASGRIIECRKICGADELAHLQWRERKCVKRDWWLAGRHFLAATGQVLGFCGARRGRTLLRRHSLHSFRFARRGRLCSLCDRLSSGDTLKSRLQGAVKSRKESQPVVDEVSQSIAQFCRPRLCAIFLDYSVQGPFFPCRHNRNITYSDSIVRSDPVAEEPARLCAHQCCAAVARQSIKPAAKRRQCS